MIDPHGVASARWWNQETRAEVTESRTSAFQGTSELPSMAGPMHAHVAHTYGEFHAGITSARHGSLSSRVLPN